VKVLVGFIDEHRAEFGVEPICEELEMAPSTYHAAKHREIAPSKRAVRDARMAPMLEALWTNNRAGLWGRQALAVCPPGRP
jgi:putative transposase